MHRMIAITSLALLAELTGASLIGSTLAASSASAAAPAGAFPVFFQPWSAAIDSNATGTIASAAKSALANPTLSVIVTGSADTVGSQAANKDLALTRAQVVADALAADGVPATRISVLSAGEVNSPGATAGSFAQFSRRVLIQIGD